MGKKKIAWIVAGILVFAVLSAVLISAKSAKPKSQTKESVTGTKREDAGRPESDDADTESYEREDPYEEPEEIVWEPEEEDVEAFEPEGRLLLGEDFDDASDTFGFLGAFVKDGFLHLTEGMQSLDASHKTLDHVILGQSFVEVSFDWKFLDSGKKGESGLEFRDLYGRLIFAAAGGYNEKTGQYELKFSANGAPVNSAGITLKPRWTVTSCSPNTTYQISFRADFVGKKVNAWIVDENEKTVGTIRDADISASGLSKMTAACYQAGAAEAIGRFRLYGPDDAGPFPLEGKKAIAFGDSIIDGHLYKEAGFVEFLAAQEGMELEFNYANNGARIMPGGTVNPADGLGGTILDCQVNVAALENRNPDYIIFDGGANDAYTNILSNLGTAGDTDVSTFAGAFYHTIRAMHEYWPDAKIVYVAVHKLGVRDLHVQEELRKLQLVICEDLGVEVADLYTREWDSTDAALNQKYAFDAFDAGQIPIAGNNTTGAHPNFLAIEELYVPVVSDALKRAEHIVDDSWDFGYQDKENTPALGEDFAGISGEENSVEMAGRIASIKFSSAKYQVAAGKNIVLKPKINPADAADPRIKFRVVSNEKYASLNVRENECEVSTKKSGAGKTVVVLAKAADGGGAEKEVEIQIMKHAVTKISIKSGAQTIHPGKKALLKASVKTNGKNANRNLIWTVSEKGIVTLNQNKDGSQCIVTARPAGAGRTVTIQALSTDGTEKYAETKIKID